MNSHRTSLAGALEFSPPLLRQWSFEGRNNVAGTALCIRRIEHADQLPAIPTEPV